MNTQYLGNHSERISHLNEMREGEVYIVGRGRDAFIAFVMPKEWQRSGMDPIEDYNFKRIPVYEARLKSCGEEIDSEIVKVSDIHIDEFLDAEIMGIFCPTQGSVLRRTIEEKLGIQETKTDSQ